MKWNGYWIGLFTSFICLFFHLFSFFFAFTRSFGLWDLIFEIRDSKFGLRTYMAMYMYVLYIHRLLTFMDVLQKQEKRRKWERERKKERKKRYSTFVFVFPICLSIIWRNNSFVHNSFSFFLSFFLWGRNGEWGRGGERKGVWFNTYLRTLPGQLWLIDWWIECFYESEEKEEEEEEEVS